MINERGLVKALPRCQIGGGVDVGRVALARHLDDEIRMRAHERAGALVAVREACHLRPQWTVKHDRVAAAAAVRGYGDWRVDPEHAPDSVRADARRVDEHDHRPRTGRRRQAETQRRAHPPFRIGVDDYGRTGHRDAVPHHRDDIRTTPFAEHSHRAVDKPLAAEHQVGLGAPEPRPRACGKDDPAHRHGRRNGASATAVLSAATVAS